MAKQYPALTDHLIEFISQQKIFFVGTATADSRINVSPKGMDSLRIIDNNKLLWLNLTGSGNESAAHVQKDSRMTIMFCAFEGAPMILRLFGTARVIHKSDHDWQALFANFKPLPGARQVFELSIDLVLTSCGMGVPYYAYEDDRDMLLTWAEKKGEAGLIQYWQEKNQLSLDNIPTNIDANLD